MKYEITQDGKRITSPIDTALYRSLTRLHDAYSGLLARRSISEVTPAELALETQWRQDLEPVLRDLYWHPLRNGLEGLPTDAAELEDRLRHDYDRDVVLAALLALLLRYQVRGVNVGGNMGLNLLSAPGHFTLTNQGYLATLHSHAQTLTSVSPNANLSLINTTISHLTQAIPQALTTASPLTALGNLIAGWSLYRSSMIAITELTRMVGNGLSWTYARNGVEEQEFVTREDAAVCQRCAPLHGRRMPVNNIPPDLLIPIHTGCRCAYRPITQGWQMPVNIWRGGP